MKWEIWYGSKEAWDKILSNATDKNIFQTYSWGELKRQSNWISRRYILTDKNKNYIGLAQVFIKKLPIGMNFIWSSGGPLFCFPNSDLRKLSNYFQSLVSEIQKDFPRSLIRFNIQKENNPTISYRINKICVRPIFKLNSGYSVQVDINYENNVRKIMTTKHRYYTKKSAKAGIEWSFGNSDKHLHDLAIIHQKMSKEKKLSSVGIKYDKIKGMRKFLNDNLLVLTGYLNDAPITSCLVLLCDEKAFYMHAATNEKGRNISAAYAMFEKLNLELSKLGVKTLDFGGIDPINSDAAGVNHFKTGFGGSIVQYVGEWEAAESNITRLLINFLIRIKRGTI